MSIWAIADVHASRTDPTSGLPEKPMDVFGSRWSHHLDRIERAWMELIHPRDSVIIAGDIDWALRPEEAGETLRRIAGWPGRKILVRGNHDYWWSSKSTNKLRRDLPDTIVLLHNTCVQTDGFNICGTKASPVPGGMDWTPQDEKILSREQQRLASSLESRDPSLPTIVALHYPPFYRSCPDTPYRRLIEQAGVAACVYGHLHGEAATSRLSGRLRGILYTLVSADTIDFRPVLVGQDGRAMAMNYRGMEEGSTLSQQGYPEEDLGQLAEQEMAEKREEMGDEAQARELYDVPTQSAADLAEEQAEEGET